MLYTRQRGAAALITSVILLIGVTLVVIFATRVGVLDQKISGNEMRHKESFANAEAGLDQAASYLRANPVLHEGNTADGWATCTGSTALFPCDAAGAVSVFATVVTGTSITSLVNNIGALPNSTSYLVKTASNTLALGVGASADGTGAAVAQIAYAKTSLLTPGELPPLMAPSADLSGSFTIVPNPNGGGPGVAVSAWVETMDASKNTGSWQTCNHGELQDGGNVCMDAYDDTVSWSSCGCIEDKSNKDDVGDDIVIADQIAGLAFPESSFAYLFGADDENTDGDGVEDAAALATLIAEIKARADATGKILANCTTLPSLDLATDVLIPLIWVEGDCSIPANSIIGDRTTPIILVVEGKLTINANGEIWGIVFGFDEFQMNGGAVVHGSAIAETSTDLTNGSYTQVYDESVFTALADDTLTSDISKIQYSWRDFTP